ncbi:MAG: acylneuraminate cytidylyltransferase family protein [Armatimonadetes bacterium]|nr:acylneuraminate cytidylyltransferase family protein [Anaerolineae bacterium]
MKPHIVALAPMRHNSGRVPGKNYRPFAGKPLYHHIVTTLLACPLIDEIVINTDSPTISADAALHFPTVRILPRPAYLCAGDVPMNEVLLYDTTQVSADFYVQTHSTNPLLRPASITAALDRFLAHYPACDTLFSVTRLQTRLWDQLMRPVNHNPHLLLRTQDLPPIYEENSNLYIFTQATLQARRNRIGERPLLHEISRLEAWDIDEELDFEIAEYLYSTHYASPTEPLS